MDRGIVQWFLMLLLSLTMAFAFVYKANAAQAWYLVDSQFTGRSWYCTYQLVGTNIQTTIESPSPCQTSIYR